ncbi:MAG: hypothetical protein ACRC56_11870 [Bosea sp. (in: a-proteobacteria)]
MPAQQRQQLQVLGSVASALLDLPPAGRKEALLGWMQQNGLDPASTDLDDYVDDPGRFESTLRMTVAAADPETMLKESIQRRQSPLQNVDGGDRALAFNPATGSYSNGPTYGVSAENRLQAGTSRYVADQSAATARRGQDVQANLRRVDQEIDRNQLALQAAQGAQRLALQRRGQALAAERVSIARDVAQWERDTGKTSGVNVGDGDEDDWEDVN